MGTATILVVMVNKRLFLIHEVVHKQMILSSTLTSKAVWFQW
jgi:hypothetical protein